MRHTARGHLTGSVPWHRRLPTRLVTAVLAPSAASAAILLGVLRLVASDLTFGLWAAVILAAIGVGAGVALLLGRRTVARLRALTDGLRELATTGSTTSVPVEGQDEVAQATEAFNRMLTERARTEAELQGRREELERAAAARTETLRRHQLAMQVGQLGVWEWEIESGWFVWSENMDATYRPAGRRLPESFDEFLESVHPEDVDDLTALLAESIRSGAPLEAEFRLAVVEGRERWLRTVGTVVQDAQGFGERVIGVAIDSTNERRSAEALRLRAAREHALAELGRLALEDTTPEALATDATGLVGQVLGAAAVRVLELRGDGDRVVVHGATDGTFGAVEEIGPVARCAVEQGDVGRGEQDGVAVIAVPVAGRAAPWGAVEVRADPLDTDHELFVQSVATLLGAAVGRLQAEEELRRGERLEAVGRLAGGVAHDFNNLLTAQLGYAELIRDSLSEDAAAHLDEIVGASERAATLVDHLMTFSRGGEGTAVAVDLAEVVRRLRGLLERLVSDDVTVQIKTPKRAIVHADPARLEQVVLNLALNGRDAMPSGGTLSLSVEAVDLDGQQAIQRRLEPGPHVRLRVADTGVGMDEATRKRALEPFFTTKGPGNTGLGLASVYGIVTTAGGALDVDSSLGAGTVVTALLPDMRAREATEAAGSANGDGPVSSAAADDEPGPAGTVLLLESQPAVRDLLETALERAGFAVTAVGDTGGASAAIEASGTPDLLVTDLLDGDDATRRLVARARTRAPHLQVLCTSGAHQAAVSQDARLTFLPKPFGPGEFVDAVERLVGNRAPA